MKSLKILFDRYGAQVQAEIGQSPHRLGPLFDAIIDAGWALQIAGGDLLEEQLDGFDVVVLTTRTQRAFSDPELDTISSFVQAGGGLWSMANHAGFSVQKQTDNCLRYNSAVASMFFTSLEAAAYMIPGTAVPVLLEGNNLKDHPIIAGQSGWPVYSGNQTTAISQVVTRSFCAVYPNAFSSPIVGLENLDGVINKQSNLPVTDSVLWALSLEGSDVTMNGRVVICGDSGWLGSENSSSPGPGEFEKPDNPQFALNTLAWLGAV